jgi:hypothetical protein
MDRKEFFKTTCGMSIGSCVGLCFLTNSNLYAASKQEFSDTKEIPDVPADARQIQNLLSYIDSSMDKSTRKKVFEKLGYEHTTKESFKNWINGYKNNIKDFFDMVNSDKDTYWESIEYDHEKSAIKITGRLVDKCACAYAQQPDAPKSLCTYCCKSFQKYMFEMLLEKPVKVRIDDAFLLGGKRCSTTIFVNGKLPLEKI